jgi:hypothetical protein
MSVHLIFSPLQPLLREFHHVFPEENLTLPADEACEFLAIPTNQHAVEDLVAIGDKIEQEKDRCLNVFMEFANDFCRKLQNAGYWAGACVCVCLVVCEFVCV